MKVLEQMKETHGSRLFIEANTPVNEVQYISSSDQSYPYLLQTPRGSIRARQVVYCTNGYTGHLLPELRGRLFPKRATMTVQDLQHQVPNQGDSISWNLQQKPRYDERTDSVINGSYYLQQNARSGYFFFGGEAQNAFTALTPDDSNASPVAVQHLQDTLPEFFGLDADKNNALISSWSGIMGFTSDSLPLVGKLSNAVTSRGGDGEWIAAGYNGGGMCLCWRTGKAVAKMIYGQDVSDWLPAAYQVSTERLERSLTIERSVRSMEYLLLRKSTKE
jgi:glycine/D-amino acid oxidase-like deaminating enzyme